MGLIADTGQRSTATERITGPIPMSVANIWSGSIVGSVYLGQDKRQLMTPMTRSESWGGHAFWLLREPIDGVDDVVVAR